MVELWDPASHSWHVTLPVPLAVTATAWSASDDSAFLFGYTSDDDQPQDSARSMTFIQRNHHSHAVAFFPSFQDLCMAARALRFNAYGTNKFQEAGLPDVCGLAFACYSSVLSAREAQVLPAPSVWRTRPAMALVDGQVYDARHVNCCVR